MTATEATLAAKAEATIRRLREVESVSVQADSSGIREIHVLTSSERPPKNLVRDIQTVLRAGLGLGIDHRVVSIARAEPREASDERAPGPLDDLLGADAEASPVAHDQRIRFESVNLFVSGARAQAQVELRWKGQPRKGSASGWSTRDGAHRLVAGAALAAVQEFLAEPV
ncbi:MAG TPA: hypothetical protein VMH61_02150, partial [Candidatus Acidoferrales bacterium]|nr:hypothetical protein [Candidatus Acidoferrales bacterium]